MEKLILLPVIAVCLTRTINYGLHTIRDENNTGAIGIFLLFCGALAASVYFFV